jgi:hypothetical protein
MYDTIEQQIKQQQQQQQQQNPAATGTADPQPPADPQSPADPPTSCRSFSYSCKRSNY